MARFVPRKSLLVLGLLVTVFGSSAAAEAAAIHPAASVRQATVTAAVHPAASARQPVATAVLHPAVRRHPAIVTAAVASAAIHPAVTTAYPAAFIAAVTSVPARSAGTSSVPATSAPATEPAGGVCSVPGIGDLGNLLSLCQGGGLSGDLNNICEPSLPQPEPANGGIDSIVRPPASSGPQGKTLYDNYGVAGQFWAATGLQCSDMTSLIGNNVAGMVFDAAKAVDRVTITVYQSAAGNGILGWLTAVVNRLITSLGNAIYFPYLVPVVLLGVVWLAWHGLIRKRATRTIEGTIWMVVACAAAIWLIGRPADFTGFGQSVSNGVTQVLNVAFSKLPSPGASNCVPVQAGDPQSPGSGNYGFTQGNGMVDQNANELWTVLVCKPWLDGEFGTTQYSTGHNGQTPVNTYGRQLLWAQAIAANETPTTALIAAKQSTYSGIAASIKAHDPAVYPLFQGNQWTSRLEIGFAAIFAALVAGVLILLIAITLIILKLGFLLLLIAGPFFLIVGTHPGFGRVVAVRWVEMIIGVLLKQVAVALVLSILLYAYSLIMGTSDAVLPWALKILMIALVTVAVFIYRKPFQHLFSAVGYGSMGARERAEIEMYRSREVLRRNTVGAATAAASGFTGYRVGRLSRRSPAQSATLADHIAAAGGGSAADAATVGVGQQAGMASMPNGQGSADANGHLDGSEAADGQLAGAGARTGAGGNGRAWAAAGVDSAPRAAPPLHLPSRMARTGDGASAAPSGWARSGAEGTAAGGPRARSGDAPARPPAPRVARTGPPQTRPAPSQAAPPRAGAAVGGPPPRAGAFGGRTPRVGSSAGPTPRVGSSAGPTPRVGSSAGPTPRVGSSGPAPRAGGSGGPPARAAAGTGSGLPGGSAPRSRWRAEAPARPAPPGRSGRPLWQPGPIRPSGGWSGGAGKRPGVAPAAPPAAAAPPASAAPPTGYPTASSAARPAAYPYSGQPRPPQRSRNGGPAHGGPRGAQNTPGDQPGASQPGAKADGQGGNGRSGGPTPFWLRPVRRKK